MTRSHRVKYDAAHPIGPQPNLNRLWRAERIARHGRLPQPRPNKFRYRLGAILGRIITVLWKPFWARDPVKPR